MIERGLLLDGKVLDVPGSELFVRDSRAWWDHNDSAQRKDLRRSLGPARLLGAHWTGGHARTGPDAGKRLVDAMKARRKDDDGDGVVDATDPLMDVSISFGGSWDGVLYQFVDLRWAAIHMSRRINPISRAIELMWPGTAAQARKLGVAGKTEVRRFGSRRVECLVPSEELMRAFVLFARAMTTPEIRAATGGLIAIERRCGVTRAPTTGAVEHWMAPSEKSDCAGYALDALHADGWA